MPAALKLLKPAAVPPSFRLPLDPLSPLREAVLRQVRRAACSRVLEVGCRSGALLSRLPEGVDRAGLDFSPREISAARRRLGGRADLRLGDPVALPWADRSFDAVVCVDALHRWARPDRVLGELRRVLERRGRLILADPWLPAGLRHLVNLLGPLRIAGGVRVYSRDELVVLLGQAGFFALDWVRPRPDAFLLVARV